MPFVATFVLQIKWISALLSDSTTTAGKNLEERISFPETLEILREKIKRNA